MLLGGEGALAPREFSPGSRRPRTPTRRDARGKRSGGEGRPRAEMTAPIWQPQLARASRCQSPESSMTRAPPCQPGPRWRRDSRRGKGKHTHRLARAGLGSRAGTLVLLLGAARAAQVGLEAPGIRVRSAPERASWSLLRHIPYNRRRRSRSRAPLSAHRRESGGGGAPPLFCVVRGESRSKQSCPDAHEPYRVVRPLREY